MAGFPKFLLDTTLPWYLSQVRQGRCRSLGRGEGCFWGRFGEGQGGDEPWKPCDWGPGAVWGRSWGGLSQALDDRQGAGPDELLEQSGVAARRETSMGGRRYLDLRPIKVRCDVVRTSGTPAPPSCGAYPCAAGAGTLPCTLRGEKG